MRVARQIRRQQQLEGEAARVAAVKASGAVPDGCGPEPSVAPARGPVHVTQNFAMYPDGAEGFTRKPDGHMGRKTMRRCDAFDVAMAQAARNKQPPPYSPSQIAIGRTYRNLVEGLAAAGIKCSSVEGMRGDGSSGGAFMDAVLADRQKLDVLQARIGKGCALQVRRVRPSVRGSRINIPDRALIDMMCVADMSLSDMLAKYGWQVEARHRRVLRDAICAALDRMIGPVSGGMRSAHFGQSHGDIWSYGVG